MRAFISGAQPNAFKAARPLGIYLENAHRNPCGASGTASAAFERAEEVLSRNAVKLARKLPEHIELIEYSQRIEKRLGACNNNGS
jgi:hypothetical protein